MRFYPKNDLYDVYSKKVRNPLYSPRIPDHTISRTIYLLNRAINICEHWGTFLDIGAGSGRNSVLLAQKFQRGIAVEIDPGDDLRDISRNNANIEIFGKPIQEIKLKKNIDFILLSDVIEHIPEKDLGDVLKHVTSMQKRGGVLYILTPNAICCGPAEQSGIYYKRHQYGHHKQYSLVELQKLFEEYGYQTVFFRYEDSPVRLLIKIVNMVISSMDKTLADVPLVNVLTVPIAFLANLSLRGLAIFSNLSERLHEFDEFNTRSIVLVLRKVS